MKRTDKFYLFLIKLENQKPDFIYSIEKYQNFIKIDNYQQINNQKCTNWCQ